MFARAYKNFENKCLTFLQSGVYFHCGEKLKTVAHVRGIEMRNLVTWIFMVLFLPVIFLGFIAGLIGITFYAGTMKSAQFVKWIARSASWANTGPGESI